MAAHEFRMKLTSSISDILFDMSEGNPGALTALAEVYEACSEDQMKYVMVLARLDGEGIYGPNIWIGYKDICEQKSALFIEKVLNGSIFSEIRTSSDFVKLNKETA